ncbi:MAG: polyprenyl synthetase family protein [Candidatus Micrarchaeia archaeon]
MVDAAIARQIPRRLGRKGLERCVGKPTYTFDLDAATGAVNAPIWDLLDRGGKRWRPALTMIVAGCLGKDPKSLADIAAASEIIHNGTLMVDDVEDSSDMRRGRPCTHIKYGVDVAVNAGNAMYYLSVLPLLHNRKKYGKKATLRAYDAYVEEMVRLSYGQGMDIHWHRGKANSVTEEQYLQMCAFKTGTIARLAAKWGAIFAGGTDAQVEAAGRLAESIGVAFQIQDDVLNLLGEEGKYGKDPGGDISEGKRTLLVIYALKHSSKKDGQRLVGILDSHTKDGKRIAKAIAIIRDSGAFGHANAVARRIVAFAWGEFDGKFPKSGHKEVLRLLADYVIDRSV